MNKKKKTKNRTLRNLIWVRRKSRTRVVHKNYGTPVGEVKSNPFLKKPEIPKKVLNC